MAKKDIQLVVRARNEATSTLNAVAESLNKVDKAQTNASKSAKAVDSSFSDLGNEVSKLASQVDSLKTMSVVAVELDKVRKTISAMEGTLTNAAGEFVKLSRESRAAGAVATELKTQTDALTVAYARQKTELDAARKETLKGSDATKEMSKAKRELDKLLEKKTDAAGIAKATTAYETAKAKVEANVVAHKNLQAALQVTGDKLGDVSAKQKAAEKNFDQLTARAKDLSSTARETKTNLDQLKQGFSAVDAQASKTASALGLASTSQKDVKTATDAASASLTRNAEVLKTMQRYSTGGAGGFADPKTAASLREQREELTRVGAGWKALEADIRSQAEAMRGLEAPTAAQVAAMERTIGAARAAKSEYRSLESGLQRFEVGMRGVASASDVGAEHVKAFNASLRQTPASPPISGWKAFYNAIYGDSRKAMSWTQRLRGEVLALGTAYIGLYGIINQVGGVIKAYQALEAAQNRLGVVFNQNSAVIRTEMLWLERQAGRLGIEFGVLSSEYGKFAIAAGAANFTAAGTREVFLSIAEAGRVAKLSTDEMGGVFLALTQIISKGKVQAEELRGQLGERLPGAINIMAKALGVTTAQLDKMMKKGEVLGNQETMVKFAKELQKQFGPQLSKALESTTTQLGKLGNNIFQAQARVGKGGFIAELNKALANLDQWFQSRAGRDFFLSLGAALGKFTSVIAEVPKYFGLIATSIQVLIGLKLAQFFIGMSQSIAKVGVTTTATMTQLDLFNARTAAFSKTVQAVRNVNLLTWLQGVGNGARAAGDGFLSAFTKANLMSVGLRVLNGAMATATLAARTLWAAVGGFPGLVITAVTLLTTTLLGNWIGGVDDATRGIDEHERILQRVLTAYESLSGVTDDWAKSIEDVTKTQAKANFILATDAYKKALEELTKNTDKFSASFGENLDLTQPINKARAGIQDLTKEFKKTGDVDAYIDGLLKLNDATGNYDASKVIFQTIELAQKTASASTVVKEAAASASVLGVTMDGLTITTEQANEVIKGTAQAASDSADALDEAAANADKYKDALDELKGLLPELSKEMKILQDLSKLDTVSLEAASAALKAGVGLGDVLSTYGQASAALRDKATLNLDTTPLQNSLDKNSDEIKAFYEQIKGKANFFSKQPNAPTEVTLNSKSWKDVNLATIETSGGIKTQVNRAAAAAFQGFINELEASGYKINQFGGFNVRNKRDGNTLSEHSFGGAIDINQAANLFSKALVTNLPKDVGQMAAKYGLSWGGDWKNKKDAMHFEFTGQTAPGTTRQTDFEIEAQKKLTAETLAQRDASEQTLADSKESLRYAALETAKKERQLAIDKAISAALKSAKGSMSTADLGIVANNAGAEWDEVNVTRVAKLRREATAENIAAMQTEIANQELLNAGKQREVEIQKAVAAEKKANPDLTQAEIDKITELAGRNYDLANAERLRSEERKKTEEAVNQLLEYRRTLQETLKMQLESGDTAGAASTQQALVGVNAELDKAIQKAIAMWTAIGGVEADAAIAKLRQTQMEVSAVTNKVGLFGLSAEQWKGQMQSFASGLTGVFDKFAQSIANGENAIDALGRAFLEFAANFLIEIGKMIIQQTIMNMLQGFFGGPAGAILGVGGSIGMGHTGGLVGSRSIGSGNGRKNLADMIPYFHNGGVVGLNPDEQLAVLRNGEEVLTENDPRHIFNQGSTAPAAPAPAPSVKIVNTFDSGDVVSNGLQSDIGQQTFINVVRSQAGTIREILK